MRSKRICFRESRIATLAALPGTISNRPLANLTIRLRPANLTLDLVETVNLPEQTSVQFGEPVGI